MLERGRLSLQRGYEHAGAQGAQLPAALPRARPPLTNKKVIVEFELLLRSERLPSDSSLGKACFLLAPSGGRGVSARRTTTGATAERMQRLARRSQRRRRRRIRTAHASALVGALVAPAAPPAALAPAANFGAARSAANLTARSCHVHEL
jgi:hypothetical protein